MDILVLADSYSHFERFIQNNGYIIKSFMKDDPAEDEDGNKYYFLFNVYRFNVWKMF